MKKNTALIQINVKRVKGTRVCSWNQNSDSLRRNASTGAKMQSMKASMNARILQVLCLQYGKRNLLTF